MSGASKSTVAFLVLLVLSLIGTAGFFFVKSRKKSQSVVQYNTMINDTDGDVEPIDPGTPAATFRNVLLSTSVMLVTVYQQVVTNIYIIDILLFSTISMNACKTLKRDDENDSDDDAMLA